MSAYPFGTTYSGGKTYSGRLILDPCREDLFWLHISEASSDWLRSVALSSMTLVGRFVHVPKYVLYMWQSTVRSVHNQTLGVTSCKLEITTSGCPSDDHCSHDKYVTPTDDGDRDAADDVMMMIDVFHLTYSITHSLSHPFTSSHYLLPSNTLFLS